MKRQAASFFLPKENICSIIPVPGGNINDSFKVGLDNGTNYLLQRLNPVVFPDPALVTANLERVCDHISHRIDQEPEDAIRMPRLIRAPGGETGYTDPQGCLWRMFTFLDETRSLKVLNSPGQAREIGRLLGRFHHWLSTLDPRLLHDPLPGFHVTPGYLAEYDRIQADVGDGDARERFCRECIEENRDLVDLLERSRPQLTTTVIHGDPKAANFLFDLDKQRAVSLIDLDTVMEGLLLHDLGDCLRSCCNPLGEDVDDPRDAVFDPERFAALLEGYAASAGELLAKADRELLVEATRLICFELGLRFFSDHLAGNRYFKIKRPNQNLHRAMIQFYLLRSMDNNRSRLEQLVKIHLP